MTTAIRRRRGTTAQHSTFIGLDGETTIDTDKEVVVVHDGTTQGGYPLMRENGSNSALALGSAGTPSLKFTGDANTGIYSPGADQVAISTNGSGRLFVDASGNVGVGATPVVPLDVQAAQATQRLYSTTGANTSHIQFRNTGGIAYVGLDNSTGSAFGAAYGLSLTHTGAYPITFVTNGSERLRITSAGLVGIGVTSVTDQLEVASGNFRGATIRCGTTAHRPTLSFFNTADSLAAYIQASGNSLIFGSMATDYGGHSPRMTLTGTGLGIGTTSPAANFHINSPSANGEQWIASGTGFTSSLFLKANGSGGGLVLSSATDSSASVTNTLNAALTFGTNNTERARIDSSGRLLVGTSSARTTFFGGGTPTEFQVEGDGEISVTRNLNDAFGGSIILGKSRSTANAILSSGDNVGNLSWQGNDGTHFAEAARINAEVDGTPGTNDMPGRLVFSVTSDGASSPTERMRINQSGQVRFGRDSNEIMWVYPTGSDRILVNANGQNTSGGYFYYNSSNAYGTASDKRLKNNIKESHKEQDAAFIKAITPHTFSFNNGATQLGFIAQDLLAASKNESQKAAVFNWESYDESDPDCPFLGVSISPVVAALVNTCKLALERIETLEAEVAALKAQ